MNTIKEILTDTLNKMKTCRDDKVNVEYNKVKATVDSQKAEVETSRTKAIAAYMTDHNTNLVALKKDYEEKKAALESAYNASVASENENYATVVADCNTKAETKKAEIEASKRAEIEASVASEYGTVIAKLEAQLATVTD